MTFTLHVDGPSFRDHLLNIRSGLSEAHVTLTPVIKGNGYGFGRNTLFREATLMEISRISIGTVWELDEALSNFAGEIHVLEPFNAHDHSASVEWQRLLNKASNRIVMTVDESAVDSLSGIGASRIFLEGQTSLWRFGMNEAEFEEALNRLPSHVHVEGLLLHLPLADSILTDQSVKLITHEVATEKMSGHVRTLIHWLTAYSRLVNKFSFAQHVSLSHLSPADLAQVTALFPEYTYEVRMGTKLWLGSPDSLRVTGTVLAIHSIAQGSAVGYQQIRGKQNARVVVISGGTSHGVALAAPVAPATLRKRLIAIIEGIQQARGHVRSPFRLGSKNFTFIEPPHMHVSMVWADEGDRISVGDKIDCTVRNTTASFDEVIGLH